MTLSELLETGLLVDDNTTIELVEPIGTIFQRTVRGHWMEDRILELTDRLITGLHYSRTDNTLKCWLASDQDQEGYMD